MKAVVKWLLNLSNVGFVCFNSFFPFRCLIILSIVCSAYRDKLLQEDHNRKLRYKAARTAGL